MKNSYHGSYTVLLVDFTLKIAQKKCTIYQGKPRIYETLNMFNFQGLISSECLSFTLCLLVPSDDTSANILDPDQAQQNVGLDLGPNYSHSDCTVFL